MGKAEGCNRKSGAWISLDIAIVPRIVIQQLNGTPTYAVDKKQTIHRLTEGREARENANTRYG